MKTIERIRGILEKDQRMRDNDELLIAFVWYYEIPEDRRQSMSAFDFLSDYSKRKFTSAESIRRCRAKLQEENPSLRGSTYDKRHKISKHFETITYL